MGRIFTLTLALGLCASFASADVLLSYDPTTFDSPAGGTVTISARANPGTEVGIGGLFFDFSASDSGLSLSDFSWLSGLDVDPWFAVDTLPDPGTAWGGALGDGLHLTDGADVPVASLSVSASGEGDFTLESGAFGFDDTLFLDVVVGKDGTSSARLTFLPEPASLCVLALGAMIATRRRR